MTESLSKNEPWKRLDIPLYPTGCFPTRIQPPRECTEILEGDAQTEHGFIRTAQWTLADKVVTSTFQTDNRNGVLSFNLRKEPFKQHESDVLTNLYVETGQSYIYVKMHGAVRVFTGEYIPYELPSIDIVPTLPESILLDGISVTPQSADASMNAAHAFTDEFKAGGWPMSQPSAWTRLGKHIFSLKQSTGLAELRHIIPVALCSTNTVDPGSILWKSLDTFTQENARGITFYNDTHRMQVAAAVARHCTDSDFDFRRMIGIHTEPAFIQLISTPGIVDSVRRLPIHSEELQPFGLRFLVQQCSVFNRFAEDVHPTIIEAQAALLDDCYDGSTSAFDASRRMKESFVDISVNMSETLDFPKVATLLSISVN